MFSYDYYVRFVFDYSNVGVNVVHDMSMSPEEAKADDLLEAHEAVRERALELLADDGIVLPEANEINIELLGIFGGY